MENDSDKCRCCGSLLTEKTVEMIPAYMWDCPHCGQENFQRSVSVTLTDEDREQMGLEEDEDGSWQTFPTTVCCRSCGKRFGTKHLNDDSE